MKLVNERNRRGHQIVAVFHPDAHGAYSGERDRRFRLIVTGRYAC